MDQLTNETSLFLQDHPEADYNAVVAHFGSPEDIAAAYIETMKTSEILKKLRIRKVALSAIAIVLTFMAVTCTAHNRRNQLYK